MLELAGAKALSIVAGLAIGGVGLHAASHGHDIIRKAMDMASPFDESDLVTPSQKLLNGVLMFLLFLLILLLLMAFFNYFKIPTTQ